MVTRGWRARQGLRVEQRPEFGDGAASPKTGSSGGASLSCGEAALLAHLRAGVLAVAGRRERQGLARARARLIRAAVAGRAHQGSAGAPVSVAGSAEIAAPGPAAALTLPPALVATVVAVVVAVEFLFWWTLARQSVRVDDYTSPAALQALALALLFPAVVFGGARIGAALGHLVGLPSGVARTWYRVRAAVGSAVVVAMSVAMSLTAQARFTAEGALVGATPLPVFPLALAFFVVPLLTLAVHAFSVHPAEAVRRRACADRDAGERRERRRVAARVSTLRDWHLAAVALDAEIRRVDQHYDLDVARGEAGLLVNRARSGVTPAPTASPVAEDGLPQTWSGLRLLPVRHAVGVSERVLRDYSPPPLGESGPLPGPSGIAPTRELAG